MTTLSLIRAFQLFHFQVWNSLSLDARLNLVADDIVEVEKKFLSITFRRWDLLMYNWADIQEQVTGIYTMRLMPFQAVKSRN